MNKNKFFIITTIALSAVLILFSCSDKKKEEAAVTPSFDKQAMLANIADVVIVPSYSAFANDINVLQTAFSAFSTTTDSANLVAFQNAIVKAYQSWQLVSLFEFGEAEQLLLRTNMNTFPTDTTKIGNNIRNGGYDLNAANNYSAKGLPALDYLAFGSAVNFNGMLNLYQTSPISVNIKQYVAAVIADMKGKVDAVNNNWISYKTSFAANTGSDVGGSIGLLVNQMTFELEILRNAKVGIPLGKKTLGTPLPEKVEAFYAQQSLDLLLKNIETLERVYLGNSLANTNGVGFDDYLSTLKTSYGSGLLSNAITNQFTLVKTKIQAITNPLSVAVSTNATVVDQAYIEIQKLLVLLKTDMTSALGVQITYQDNDGD